MKLENRFRKRLCDDLQALRGSKLYIQKNHGSQFSSGLPDLELQDYNFGKVWLELKALEEGTFHWTKQPTPLQFGTLQRIYAAGGNARVLIWHAGLKVIVCVPIYVVAQLKAQMAIWTTENFKSVGLPYKPVVALEGETRNMFWGATLP